MNALMKSIWNAYSLALLFFAAGLGLYVMGSGAAVLRPWAWAVICIGFCFALFTAWKTKRPSYLALPLLPAICLLLVAGSTTTFFPGGPVATAQPPKVAASAPPTVGEHSQAALNKIAGFLTRE